jgi:hydrophobic/amphiphilic exporter-1 (mainly G- bacteria), HAE1 family
MRNSGFLPAFSLRRPVTVMMTFLALAAIGLLAMQRISLEMMPQGFTTSYLGIWVSYPNATAEEVSEQIAIPFEEILRTVQGIENIETNSSENGVWIWLEFDKNADMDVCYNQVRDRIDRIEPELPDDVQRVRLRRMGMEDEEIVWMAVNYPPATENLYFLAENYIRPAFEQIDGVAGIEIHGADEKQILIDLDLKRISAHGIDISALITQLQNDNIQFSSGRTMEGDRRLQVRSLGLYQSVDEIANIVIHDTPFRLRDLAHVKYGRPDVVWHHRVNGSQGMSIGIMKEGLANAVDVSDQVLLTIEQRLKTQPELSEFKWSILFDQGQIIKGSLANVTQTALWGGLFAFMILLLFLRRLRMTVIITLAIPFAAFMAIAVMYFIGWSLNIITMMGLMISIGMVVDCAIVVMESIFVRRQEGLDPPAAAVSGAGDVGMAVVMSTLTTVVVFAPIIFLGTEPEVGFFLKRIGVPIIVALVASLFASMLFIPLLSVKMGHTRQVKEQRLLSFLRARTILLLKLVLRHRVLSLLIITAFYATIIIPMKAVQPSDAEGNINDFNLRILMPSFYTIDDANLVFGNAEAVLEANRERFRIKAVSTRYSNSRGRLHVFLQDPPRYQWYQYFWQQVRQKWLQLPPPFPERAQVMEELKEQLPEYAGVEYIYGWNRGGGRDAAVNVRLEGPETRLLHEYAQEVKRRLETIPSVTSTELSLDSGKDEIQIEVNRRLVEQVGLSPQQIAGTVTMALRGREVGRLQLGEREIPIRVRIQESDRRYLDQLRNLPLITASGEKLPLGTLAEFTVEKGLGTIHRSNGNTSIAVRCFTAEDDLFSLRRQIQPVMEGVHLPLGYNWALGNRFDRLEQIVGSRNEVIVLSIVLVYILMGVLFESFLLPLVVMFSIPFAFFGAWWALYITGGQMDIMAGIGIIILIGVVVNNAIVLIDRVVQLRHDGRDRMAALLEASHNRFRPVMMTAFTTIFGLVPMAMGNSSLIGIPYAPMGRAMIGGLLVATLFTLVVVPLVYTILDDIRLLTASIVNRVRKT